MGCFEGELCFPLLSLSFSSWQHDVAAAPAAGAVPFVVPLLLLPAAVAALPKPAVPLFHVPLPPDEPFPPSEETKTLSVHKHLCIKYRQIYCVCEVFTEWI